jgi:hypothetical protein
MIIDKTEISKKLTVHTCTGKISTEEIKDTVKALYDGDPTPNHLWDMTEADVFQIESDELRQLAQFAKKYAPTRVGGKTAIVASTEFAFGLGRMYEIFANSAGQNVDIKVFQSILEAESWLNNM